ncbi:D-arabinitol 4-dehydrogenase [Piscinibacter sakaiensis]|uniref:D-arabinitol 4-dehydrogenase n=1 Tax=Piscinibacter sakaiensis TaxID=1547922 RepID=UPI003AB07EC8
MIPPMDASGAGGTILHIGVGSFHRAHQAVYLDALRKSGDTRWAIVGGNIRNDMQETMAALAEQQGQYTLETVSPVGERRYERIEAIREVIPFDPQLTRLVEVGADAATRIISFTVTEAGYYLDGKNRLDAGHADLRADLESGSTRTIYGALTAILRQRVVNGGAPVTLLNCDNLRSNGARLRAGLLDFLERRGESNLLTWVKAFTSCPSNMVDRITPRPSPDVAERVLAATGWADRAPVMAESFAQWVIEDDFIAGRPAWERVGAEMVTSVHAHEEAKIRLLNGTHSCVAWAGTLKGLLFIHEDLAVPAIRQMAFDYATHDVIPCLDRPDHPSPFDLAAYRDVVLHRFGNPHVCDTNQRVAMDGFAKIQGFIVPTLRECIERGAPLDATAVLPALFFEVLRRWHLGELPYRYQDGLMDEEAAHAFFSALDPLLVFCSDPLLWGPLAAHPELVAAVRNAHARVLQFIRD